MKFTIRDLFLVTVIVALVVGWWVDHWQPVTTARIKAMLLRGGYHLVDGSGQVLQYMTSDGGSTVTAWEFTDEQGTFPLPNSPAPAPNPAKP
jgi:hypothetical protein